MMNKTINNLAYASMLLISVGTNAYGASYTKAEMLNEHGLVKESKSELIDLLISSAAELEKAKAYYLLGTIAFSENKNSTALESWRQLIKKYPNSKEAMLVKDRLKVLAEMAGETGKEAVDNSIAQSYLNHGDFWSKGKDYKFSIDASWIRKDDAAIAWYDKVIKEYPGTTASRIAYEEKMRTLVGWKEPGRNSESNGIQFNFGTYMPKLLETFANYEKEHPNASLAQAFRYQIAQSFWGYKNWADTRKWLNLIIEKSGDVDGFYKDAAKRRLEKVEY